MPFDVQAFLDSCVDKVFATPTGGTFVIMWAVREHGDNFWRVALKETEEDGKETDYALFVERHPGAANDLLVGGIMFRIPDDSLVEIDESALDAVNERNKDTRFFGGFALFQDSVKSLYGNTTFKLPVPGDFSAFHLRKMFLASIVETVANMWEDHLNWADDSQTVHEIVPLPQPGDSVH